MADHPRQIIRKAVVDLLVAARTDAGFDVFPTRKVQWREDELPAIAVYTLEETSERKHPEGSLDRHMVLAIHAIVQASDGVDDALDTLALQIEKAMAADQTLGGLVLFSHLSGTEIDVDEGTSQPVGGIRLAYAVWYHTSAAVSRP